MQTTTNEAANEPVPAKLEWQKPKLRAATLPNAEKATTNRNIDTFFSDNQGS